MNEFYIRLGAPKLDYFDKVQLYQRRFDTEGMIFLQSDIRIFKEELARISGQLESHIVQKQELEATIPLQNPYKKPPRKSMFF